MPRSLAALTDAELLARTPHDPDAFLVVHDRWASVLRGWARRRTRDETQAADVVAETFAQALQHAGRFRDDVDGSAGPWLFGIAANVLRHTWRRGETETGVRRRLGGREIPLHDPGYEAAERRADADAATEELHEALGDLPDDQREAVLLRVVEELSYDEVAARLACSNDAARLRVSRGLRRLRLRLVVLTLLTFLALAAVAVATGLVSLSLGTIRGDALRVRALDGRGEVVAKVRCPTTGDRHPLCARRPGAGPGVAQMAEALRASGATAGVTVSATFCHRGRCRELSRPREDAAPGRPGVTTFLRTGVRVSAAARRTGGYRGTPSAETTTITLPGRGSVACPLAGGGGSVCRAYRRARAARPFRIADVATALGARWAILESGGSCRLETHLECTGLALSVARRRSADPLTIPARGTAVSYTRTVVVGER